jgi:hypothetical protein
MSMAYAATSGGRAGFGRIPVAALIVIGLAGPASASTSTGCISANHGSLDMSTTITKARFFNYGGDFEKGETLRFATSSGTLSISISRNQFGHLPDVLRWVGAKSRDYPIDKTGSYSFQVVLSAIPFQTANLVVSCTPVPEPQPTPEAMSPGVSTGGVQPPMALQPIH